MGAIDVIKPYEFLGFGAMGVVIAHSGGLHTKTLPGLAPLCGQEPGEAFSGIGEGVFFD